MHIHFAYGYLGKHGEIEEQSKRFINEVLETRQLKISICKEFIPIPNKVNGEVIHFDITQGKVESGEFRIDTRHTTSQPSITYLPEDVSMVCFIDIPFNKLSNSLHSREYGKLGIVFQKEFYKKHELKNVVYYDEKSIIKDTLIIEFCKNNQLMSKEEKENLIKEITTYRKPKVLTKNFSLSVVATISHDSNITELSFFTYNRYPIDYDFTNESECRLSFDKGKSFLEFNEKDVFMVIAPTKK